MKIFVAGASGVIGRRLVPLLVEAGHEVVGMTRSSTRAPLIERSGARAVVCDVFAGARLRDLLKAERPEVVIDQLTDLPKEVNPRKWREQLAGTNHLRTEGTRMLVDAALDTGVRRVVSQSWASAYAPAGGPVKSEDAPLNVGPEAPQAQREVAMAVLRVEQTVTTTPGIEGVALRYGYFYGPDTVFAADGSVAETVRRRGYPIVGDGGGVTSFVHVDDAAAATVLALSGPTGVYNICDDEPARLAEWLPVYANALGAPPPHRVPAFLARILGGDMFVAMSTEQCGASNKRARRVLGFEPCFPSWRQGFVRELARGRQAA